MNEEALYALLVQATGGATSPCVDYNTLIEANFFAISNVGANLGDLITDWSARPAPLRPVLTLDVRHAAYEWLRGQYQRWLDDPDREFWHQFEPGVAAVMSRVHTALLE